MEENLAAMLSDTARLMRRAFDARARQIGVTRPQWQVLVAIRRNAGIKQGALADLLEVEPITVCRMVDRLQEAELVERRPDPADRRAWCLHLAPRADELIAQLLPLATEMLDMALDGVGAAERNAFTATLDRIRQNLVRKPAVPMVQHG